MIGELITLTGGFLASKISEHVPVTESFNDRERALNDYFITDFVYGSLAVVICWYIVKQ